MNAAAERLVHEERLSTPEQLAEVRNGEVLEFSSRERAARRDLRMEHLLRENAQLHEELAKARREIEQKETLIRNARLREFELRAALLRIIS
jgi:hypothetical protein